MTDHPEALSQKLTDIVERVGPALLTLNGARRTPTTAVAWSADGLLLAPAHACERDEGLQIGLPGEERAEATVLGRDTTTDIALLRVDAPLQPSPFAPLQGVRVGQLVLALARPGRTVRARLGILSVRSDSYTTAYGGKLEAYLETDIVPRPGYGGGAVVDLEGRIIGLNSSALARHSVVTIPAVALQRVAEQLKAHGRIRRGYLGVGTQAVPLPSPLAAQSNTRSALMVLSVEPGSPADTAGISFGDALVSVNDRPLDDVGDLLSLLGEDSVGQPLKVRALRGGQLRDLTLTVAQRP